MTGITCWRCEYRNFYQNKYCSECHADLFSLAASFKEKVPVPPLFGPKNFRRKDIPIFSGVLRYFPDALKAVARLSKAGNDKHNPGEPLHWARDKSNDHGDCLVRHQLEFDQLDPETGEYHAVAVAWRALAQLQLLEELKRQ